ncbi:MAG: peptide-methionine (S)-S-oxide reductase, partial [Gammaproteobacteria bacterium]
MNPLIKRTAGAVVLTLCASFSNAGSAATAKATFAGGCFWCTESDFEKVPGVISAVSGYIGGSKPDPSYEEVSAGASGHAEAVEIVFDPAKVSYQRLLYVYWRSVDPT